MTTNVPPVQFTPAGVVLPPELSVLAGVQADINTAFGGGVNPGLSTPQGQLAQSLTAIIGDKNDQVAEIANQVNPDVADGRWQDAIGRIYFLDRIAASGTVVVATISGLVGTVIPAGSVAQDTGGYRYATTADATIGSAGTVDVQFQGLKTGPIAIGAGALTTIYTAVVGWESVTNISAGTPGIDVETRAEFERRRRASVALNASGSLPSIYANVLNVSGVLDAYAAENNEGSPSGAQITASIAGTTMNVSAVASGAIAAGQMVTGPGVQTGTLVESFGSGSGGAGTYTVSISQTVGSAALQSAVGGVSLLAHSIYIAAYGGAAEDIAKAIFRKKNPGCNYNGSTSVVVSDDVNYLPPYPTYTIKFQIPTPTAIKFAILMQSNPDVPSNAIQLIRAAVVAAFNGADDGPKARIGSAIFALRYAAGIAALGAWARAYSIQVGVGTANKSFVLIPINAVPTITDTDISVTFA